jgi:glycosyltransferase involved in cell wall biosynthesis
MCSGKSRLISIVTVVKDDFENFQVTALSLLRQNSQDFRWIIIDGSATEQIQLFLENFPNGMDIDYKRQSPKGIYFAMNYGATFVTDGWIWYLNAGDFLTSVNTMGDANEAVRNSRSGVIASEVIHLSATGFAVAYSVPHILSVGEYRVANFNHQGVLMRKELFSKLGGFDESLKFASDGKLLDLAISESEVEFIKGCYVSFRLGGASTQNYKKSINEAMRYRPSRESFYRRLSNSLHNLARLVYLKFETIRFTAPLIKIWLKKREERIISGARLELLSHNENCHKNCPVIAHMTIN